MQIVLRIFMQSEDICCTKYKPHIIIPEPQTLYKLYYKILYKLHINY